MIDLTQSGCVSFSRDVKAESREVHLFQKSSFLYDVCNCFHLHTFSFVDILEGIKFSRLLMLDNADLRKDRKMFVDEELSTTNRIPTFPKAPFPTLFNRIKWKRFTSPSKSTGYRTSIEVRGCKMSVGH